MSRLEDIDYALTGDDLRCLGDSVGASLTPLAYRHLRADDMIEHLIPTIGDGIALLYEVTPNAGHWTLLMRPSANRVEFFDSYGLSPDSEEEAGALFSKRSGPLLIGILHEWSERTGGDVVVNGHQLQDLTPHDNVCGRWVFERFRSMDTPIEDWIDQYPGPPAKNDLAVIRSTNAALLACNDE